jgi:uncharacterized protein YbjT (DUF2867 family)
MTSVLVTGGTGVLGRQLVPRLVEAGHSVRVLSRRDAPQVPEGVTSVRGELASGEGLTKAVAGAEVIVHCATSPTRQARRVDVEGTKRLLEAAHRAGCGHFLYISIVGIDRVPFPYYKVKLEAERAIEASGVPSTNLRATQFHDLILRLLQATRRLPFVVVPRSFVFQVVDAAEVASRLADLAAAGPSGRVPDMGGPEVRRIEDLARSYAAAVRRKGRLFRLPIPGGAARGFRAGRHTCPDHADGTVTWEEFLAARFSPPTGQ